MRMDVRARRRGNVVVAVDARDLLDEVLLDREIEAARRRRHDEASAPSRTKGKPRRVNTSATTSSATQRREVARRARCARARDRAVAGALAARTSVSGPARPPQISRIELRRTLDRARAAAEVDAALEAIPCVAREPEAAHLALDDRGVPERAFEVDARRVVGDARVLAAHDACEAERFLLVRNEQQIRGELEHLAVQQRELLALAARSARRSSRRAGGRRRRAGAGRARASRSS